MQYAQVLWVTFISAGLAVPAFAQNAADAAAQNSSPTTEVASTNVEEKASSLADTNEIDAESSSAVSNATTMPNTLRVLRDIKIKDLTVNATAALPEEEKDPLQPLNRKIYAFNDVIDRSVLRPIAVQYTEKVPEDVRESYRSFRNNFGEPWNAVNQVVQGRFSRALKTLGRFTINTVTTLGLADPAQRLQLTSEDEDFGSTLGYYGVPSGPYLVIPFLGPSTFRDGFGRIVDSQARPQRYILDGVKNEDRIYYSDLALAAIDTRAQLLDVEAVLQGDKYAALRDAYLQRKSFLIAEKRGIDAEAGLFIDDVDDEEESDTETTENEDSNTEEAEESATE